jgi:NAD(P) transhydrogenase
VAAGATITAAGPDAALTADLVLKVRAPTDEEVAKLGAGTTLFSFVYPAQNAELLAKVGKRGATLVALDCVPRISRAQSMDALSSMSNASGYKAVVEAAHHFGRFFTGQMTAAGKVPPAKVLVIGCGVAGLAAIGTAKAMGAIVRGFDTRSAAREQVLSVGGQFLTIEIEEDGDGAGGYAKEMSQEFIDAEMKLFAEQCAEVDIVITTALIPGRPAPKLISRAMVESMRPGSVIVDLAAEAGGNVETTRPGETYVHDASGVTHVGATDFPSQMSSLSSTLYANNLATIIKSMTIKDAGFVHDMEDDVVRGATVLHRGAVTWPPPPPKVDPNASLKKLQEQQNAAPKLTKAEIEAQRIADEYERTHVIPQAAARRGALMTSAGVTALMGVGAAAPTPEFVNLISVCGLAGVAGYQSVWGVAHSLHSPLMSVTNAISGLTAAGGLLIMGGGLVPTNAAQALGVASVFASCINIGGGFTITTRMLNMFKREGDPEDFNRLYIIPAGTLVGGYAAAGLAGHDLTQVAYLFSAVCCISSIAGLASQESARLGNTLGVMGVSTGIAATIGSLAMHGDGSVDALVLSQMAIAIAAGTAIGTRIARKIEVTDLPQLTAAFHSVVGLAAVLTSAGSYIANYEHMIADVAGDASVHKAAIYGGVFIGAVTTTGSIVAWGKLQGVMSSAALALPGKNLINIALAATCTGLGALFMQPGLELSTGVAALAGASGVAGILGWHLVMSVGGADAPVCVTLLNAYSGFALVAEGFLLDNHLLTVVGALIGCSGSILSKIMCDGMGRSILSVIFGGALQATGEMQAIEGTHKEIDLAGAADMIADAKDVMIVPGYGLATAKAQTAIAEFAKKLNASGVRCRFLIHPVAGRLPGQLNVLISNAGVDYEIVHEMEELNDEMGNIDVCLVIGANDTVNTSARDDPNSPLFGMPIINADWARNTIVLKRSMGTGYAAIDNPLFYKEKTHMLLGDAKGTCESLNAKLNELLK